MALQKSREGEREELQRLGEFEVGHFFPPILTDPQDISLRTMGERLVWVDIAKLSCTTDIRPTGRGYN